MTALRSVRGRMAHYSGAAAEEQIARDYQRRGLSIAKSRWRGPCGEIDLITRDGDEVIFVEVKKARTFDEAAQRLGSRQAARIYQSAEAFLAGEPKGSLTSVRFDVALVDGQGQFRIIENAFDFAA